MAVRSLKNKHQQAVESCIKIATVVLWVYLSLILAFAITGFILIAAPVCLMAYFVNKLKDTNL